MPRRISSSLALAASSKRLQPKSRGIAIVRLGQTGKLTAE
jgi:hypothetical protein